MTADLKPIRTALLSVSDKTGLVDLARALAARDVALISTGGTAKALREAGLKVRDVADITGFPEMMEGRVKTLHPKIHGGLLALRDKPDHAAAMEAHDIAGIDLLAVNLYPFEATRARGADFDECVENIDIGGPAMIRAGAKNHAHVLTLTDPADYAEALAALEAHEGAVSHDLRKRMAARAYARTARYDAAIADWYADQLGADQPADIAVSGKLAQLLRYGENPHQSAALYLTPEARPGAARAALIQGKPLSYNNINDADAAYELVAELDASRPACVIIKHANPCGAAYGETLAAAYGRAFDCDRISAFGGVIALNQPINGAAAQAITGIFTEVVIAPGADAEAREVFAKKPNLRLLIAEGLPDPKAKGRVIKPVAGGLLVQGRDNGAIAREDLRVVTKRAPDEAQIEDLLFAWRLAKHVKSNAIVYVKDGACVGVGAGQMSRVDSTRIAASKAREMQAALGLAQSPTVGSVVASDAFFPFPDGLLAAAEAGATAVIQPGGALRDAEVIKAADEAGLAMVFTGMRHFRH